MSAGDPVIAPFETVRALYADPRTRVFDVREPSEFAAGALARAVNIPHTTIGAAGDKLPADRTTPIVVHCAKGRRAQAALETLQTLGYTNVTNAGCYDSIRQLDQ
eukprot:TRINITY_DN7799_c0_g1_i1.p1 TRINITY_DN7799_c0_g1~~TRINITY_DN7799_c0_g1_i1.p1  ORF type:complete len:112 (-),score=32.07 TRINITY_DN7799_c0_g1_i1:141-455(-)